MKTEKRRRLDAPDELGAVDRCICCGEPIPEGRQVCVKCEKMDLEKMEGM